MRKLYQKLIKQTELWLLVTYRYCTSHININCWCNDNRVIDLQKVSTETYYIVLPLTDVSKTSIDDGELNLVDEIVLDSLEEEPCGKMLLLLLKSYCTLM